MENDKKKRKNNKSLRNNLKFLKILNKYFFTLKKITKQSIQKLNFNSFQRTITIEKIGGAEIELKLAEQEGYECLKQKLVLLQESGKKL